MENFTQEQLEQYAAQRARQQRNEYNRRHPEKTLQQRLRASANLLRRHGFTVIKGVFPAPPWTDLQVRMLEQAILANQEGLRNE